MGDLLEGLLGIAAFVGGLGCSGGAPGRLLEAQGMLRGGFGQLLEVILGNLDSKLGPFWETSGWLFAISKTIGSGRWLWVVPRRVEVCFDCAGAAFSRVRRCRVGSLLDRFGVPKVKLFGSFWEPIG